MEKQLILTVGLPRSGKSTWVSKQNGIPIVNPDSIRLALHGQRFIAEAEGFVWAIAKTMTKSLFLAGHDKVIIDATNTTKERRNFWRSKSWDRYFVVFTTPADICFNRAFLTFPDLEPVIEKMQQNWETPTYEEGDDVIGIEFYSGDEDNT